MKEVQPTVKAILASGYCDPRIKAEMIKEGAKDFIQKPYVSDFVLRRIREILDEDKG
jgi:two-component system, cell cycle sensor histidine kinase and response regulator CckA